MSAASMESLHLLILLVVSRFVCDFVLQSDRMAVEKIPGRDDTLHWSWWLGSHASTHGLAVALLTGVPLLGLFETLLHAIIDWLKIRCRFTLVLDQSLHLLCKLVWVLILIKF